MLTRFLSVFFVISFSSAMAQNNLTHDSQYWFKYYNQIIFTNGFSWHNEADTRHSFETNKQQQFIGHSRLHKSLNENINIAAGFTYSSVAKTLKGEPNSTRLNEFRPVQEFNYSLPYKRLVIQNRLRLDERFLQNISTTGPSYYFLLRYRYRLQLNYILKPQTIYEARIKLGDEIMLQTGKETQGKLFDQNRVSIAYDQNLGKNFSVELSYIYLYHQKISRQEFLSRDILRVSLNHKINRNEQN
ncbi:MAG: DUF2490 domain-containing protein [Cytophagales bacterium]|nr:DUF2490 domain-containing protein [Cytophagales bacterium]